MTTRILFKIAWTRILNIMGFATVLCSCFETSWWWEIWSKRLLFLAFKNWRCVYIFPCSGLCNFASSQVVHQLSGCQTVTCARVTWGFSVNAEADSEEGWVGDTNVMLMPLDGGPHRVEKHKWSFITCWWTMCWCQYLPACKSQLLNFQKYWELVVGYYSRNQQIGINASS